MLNKTKVSLTDFNPDVLFSFPDSVQEVLLGVILGRATDLIERKSPSGDEVFTGLKGDFQCHFATINGNAREAVSSGVCFLPEAFQGPLEDMLSDEVDANGVVTREGASAVQFGFEVFAKRDGNARKRTWVLRPVVQADAEKPVDPLAGILAAAADQLKALAAPTEQAAIADKSNGKK